MKVRCANCRKTFNVKPSARKNRHGWFCSQRCRMIKQNPRRKHFIDKIPLKQYCESNGLNYALIVERMRKKCCSPEEAIKLPYNSHCYHYLTTGERLIDYCKRTGRCYKNCLKKIKKGMSVDESIKPIVIDYSKSIKRQCKNRKHYHRVLYKLKKGWLLKPAIYVSQWARRFNY